MRFLVTGGAGFIGSHLCEQLIDYKHEVVCLDNFNHYYNPDVKHGNIKKIRDRTNFKLIKGDILDYDLLTDIFNDINIDIIIHLAARAGVRPSIQDPLLYQKVNIEGTANLLEIGCKNSIKKFIFASSSSVYGNNKKIPFFEDDFIDHPISPYAATKKACELLAYTFFSLYSLSITCLRFFTVYGPRQRPDMAIHKFTRLIDKGEDVPVFGDGKSRRDYTYISDIIDGIMKAVKTCKGYNIYNLGESQTIELNELIKLIEKELGKKAKIKQLPDQLGDVRITYADISKARTEIGYDPSFSIETGIKEFVNWYRDNNS